MSDNAYTFNNDGNFTFPIQNFPHFLCACASLQIRIRSDIKQSLARGIGRRIKFIAGLVKINYDGIEIFNHTADFSVDDKRKPEDMTLEEIDKRLSELHAKQN